MSHSISRRPTVAAGRAALAQVPKYSGDVRAQLVPSQTSRADAAPGLLPLPYLAGYAPALQRQVRQWFAEGRLASWLRERHPQAHGCGDDRALFDYVEALRLEYLRNAGQVHRVLYDSRIHVVNNALGLHTRRAIAHGGRLSARHEIRIAAMFRQAPPAFLRMIVVHELAHLRELEHNRAFYQLCEHMEPDYRQLEFEVRVYLCWLEHTGQALW